jgi:hypothetical protein
MEIKKFVTILGAAALLAGCGGGGGGASPSTLPSTTNPNPTQNVGTGLTIGVDLTPLKPASKSRLPQQITSGTTALQVTVTNSAINSGNPVETTYTLSSPPCSGGPTTYSCIVAAPTGSDSIYVATAAGSTIVGYSVPQTKMVTSGETTAANFVLTPITDAFSGNTTTPGSGGNLPEDGSSHSVALTANVLDLNGVVISSPIDTSNLFGTVTVTTAPTYTVTGPTQAAANATTGSYAAAGYTFSYDGTQVGSDSLVGTSDNQLAVKGAYTVNAQTGPIETLYNDLTAPTTPTLIFSIPLVRLELPQTNIPSDATLHGSVFNPGDSASGSYYYITPSTAEGNNGTTAAVVFNGGTSANLTLNVTTTNDSTTPVSGGSTTCGTGGAYGTSVFSIGSPVNSSGTWTTQITINNPSSSLQSASCVLEIVAGAFSSLTQTVTIYPTTVTLGTSSVNRQK